MSKKFYYSIENSAKGTQFELDEMIAQLNFNEDGLVPVIAQQFDSKAVLMLAWMNKDAIYTTLETGKMTYWSRSRQQYWVKGESSGHTQTFKSMSFDCDGDALLCLVDQNGGACHTGRSNCFYHQVDGENQKTEVDSDPVN